MSDKEQLTVEELVDKILEPYGSVLSRLDISKVFGISYHSVPKTLENKQIKYSKNGDKKWSAVKIHKEFIRQALIKDYS